MSFEVKFDPREVERKVKAMADRVIEQTNREINAVLASASPDATTDELTDEVCRVLRRNNIKPNREQVRAMIEPQVEQRRTAAGETPAD